MTALYFLLKSSENLGFVGSASADGLRESRGKCRPLKRTLRHAVQELVRAQIYALPSFAALERKPFPLPQAKAHCWDNSLKNSP
jgi:hypothetical protein